MDFSAAHVGYMITEAIVVSKSAVGLPGDRKGRDGVNPSSTHLFIINARGEVYFDALVSGCGADAADDSAKFDGDLSSLIILVEV
jgi:hypothetical protein